MANHANLGNWRRDRIIVEDLYLRWCCVLGFLRGPRALYLLHFFHCQLGFLCGKREIEVLSESLSALGWFILLMRRASFDKGGRSVRLLVFV